MQFQKLGKRVRVLSYRGYDKDKKRSIVKFLGSLDAYTFAPSDGLIEALTDDEKTELQAYIEKERQARQDSSDSYVMRSVVNELVAADALLVAGMAFDVSRLDADKAASVWRSIRALEAMLTTAGYPKPKRGYGKSKTKANPSVARQQDLIDPK
jgi:hypothetical protein